MIDLCSMMAWKCSINDRLMQHGVRDKLPTDRYMTHTGKDMQHM